MNNISFKAKINFVSPSTFDKVAYGKDISYYSFVTGHNLKTHSIRNCIGVLAVDYKNKFAKGGHIYPHEDYLSSNNITDSFCTDFTPQKAFLIGSKKLATNDISIQIFQKFKNLLKKNIKDLTLFEQHTYPFSESDFVYHYDNDTLTVCTSFKRPKEAKEHYVSNLNELLECFKIIEIAKDDILCFEDKPVDLEKYYNNGLTRKQKLKDLIAKFIK
ncbi:MAG: hypothetical protein MJ237_01590 [bacterium]|nr:hypothetical protein [bacterium]